MVIGLNLLYLIPGRVGGTETYARELLRAMTDKLSKDDSLVIYCGREAGPTFQSTEKIEIVTLPFSSNNRFARILFEQLVLPLRCLEDKLDIIFSLGYSAPFVHPCPSVVTIHDLNWYYHPEDFNSLNRSIWKYVTTLSAKTSNRVITDSQASAQSIISVLKVNKNKVIPILHGVPKKIDNGETIKSQYIFTVVAGYPHKNLQTLIQAFAKLSREFPSLRLKVCGLKGKADNDNANLIKRYSLEDKVDILGYVSRQQLSSLYRSAEVFVFPSAYEGFGYPVIEAMSYGVPVISSNAFSLKEVVGDGGILVDPYDVDGYVKAVRTVLLSSDRRSNLIKRGKLRITELKWSKTVEQTLKVLRQVAK